MSRVGGAAQTGAMKSVAGGVETCNMHNLENYKFFAQFGSELDPATLSQLERGKRVNEILNNHNTLPFQKH